MLRWPWHGSWRSMPVRRPLYFTPHLPPLQHDETHLVYLTATREVRSKDCRSGNEAGNPTRNLMSRFTPDVPKRLPYPGSMWTIVRQPLPPRVCWAFIWFLFWLHGRRRQVQSDDRERRWELSGRRAAHPLVRGKLDAETWPSPWIILTAGICGWWILALGRV